MRTDHPLSVADAALEYAGPLSAAWAQLPDALHIESTWATPDVFSLVASDDSCCASHHRMLRSYARHDYLSVVRALDLNQGDSIVDAGGGLGVLAQMVLDVYPSTSIIVLERPEVVALGRKQSADKIHWYSANIFDAMGYSGQCGALVSRSP